ncbi:hypothetical protein CAOG_08968 [Capsaspora owczarzaki ATCC 30864]|uniref:hypothetical protein n=1 Tax=Capsaspora owczarzaki (strain ATCC 30864) TaxID=595528 RepID=UPI00035243AF|nr:hypothetical protein CAOG_08968 [Capsaspora owczarzaki ATCC 30864]|eukprot:XP_011270646.1 hypothetical protein CAOG_08968 [Capsaspora owczarzaki ATCC 30864]
MAVVDLAEATFNARLVDLATFDGAGHLNVRNKGSRVVWQLRFPVGDCTCMELVNQTTFEAVKMSKKTETKHSLEFDGRQLDGRYLFVTIQELPENRAYFAAVRVLDTSIWPLTVRQYAVARKCHGTTLQGRHCLRTGSFFDYCHNHIGQARRPTPEAPLRETRQYKSLVNFARTEALDISQLLERLERLGVSSGESAAAENLANGSLNCSSAKAQSA